MENVALNLFALTDVPGMRILRVPVSQEVQVEITKVFIEQEEQFLSGIEEEIKFDGKYRPEEKELLVIDDFDDVDGLKMAVQNPLNTQELVLSEGVLEGVKALFVGYKDKKEAMRVLLQGFEKKRIISPKGFSIFHAGNTFKRFEGSGLTLDSKLTAVMENDALKFASFHFVRQIFDMSAYYKEATDQDLTNFAQHHALQVVELAEFIKTSDTWVRKKVGLIQQSGILEKYPPSEISAVAKLFSIDLPVTEVAGAQKIVFPKDRREVKRVLRFLDEDYYQSPLTTTKYLSNSKRAVD